MGRNVRDAMLVVLGIAAWFALVVAMVRFTPLFMP